MNSSGDWLDSADLSKERLKATYEYAGVPESHLTPQGVSTIVDTSTTEVVEAYTAIISDLFLSNFGIPASPFSYFSQSFKNCFLFPQPRYRTIINKMMVYGDNSIN